VTDAERLPVMFRHFAEQELDSYSARYAQLARFLTDRPALARPLLAAPRSQQRAILLFAAVQYLLRTSAAGHPLAGYLPVLGGARPAGEGLTAAFTDLVATHRAELAELCATRLIQTNEATRAALLRPGLGRAAELVARSPWSSWARAPVCCCYRTGTRTTTPRRTAAVPSEPVGTRHRHRWSWSARSGAAAGPSRRRCRSMSRPAPAWTSRRSTPPTAMP